MEIRPGPGLALSRTEPMNHPSPSNAPPRKSILVVDDDPGTREAIYTLLSPNYRVTLAIDGVDGYVKANEQPPDLIIADVFMPELDGIAMVRRIRESGALRHVPVIFLSAQMSPANVIAGLSVGAFAYLQKPTGLEMLENKVKRALWH
jgi:two-component system sensor histidine kinase ChiS